MDDQFHENGIALIRKYFPDMNEQQEALFTTFAAELLQANQSINLISRKDALHLYERHILHSLSIVKGFHFQDGSKILDGGTGGGLPGIPLAFMFPACKFQLADSRKKKCESLQGIVDKLGVSNIEVKHSRIEAIRDVYDYGIFRAVAPLKKLRSWTRGNVKKGILCLKGGDLKEELEGLKEAVHQQALSTWFDEPFFKEKHLLCIRYDASDK